MPAGLYSNRERDATEYALQNWLRQVYMFQNMSDLSSSPIVVNVAVTEAIESGDAGAEPILPLNGAVISLERYEYAISEQQPIDVVFATANVSNRSLKLSLFAVPTELDLQRIDNGFVANSTALASLDVERRQQYFEGSFASSIVQQSGAYVVLALDEHNNIIATSAVVRVFHAAEQPRSCAVSLHNTQLHFACVPFCIANPTRRVAAISAGVSNTHPFYMLLTSDGAVYSWADGQNAHGELGRMYLQALSPSIHRSVHSPTQFQWHCCDCVDGDLARRSHPTLVTALSGRTSM